ncbi:MAG: ROK family protein [Saprospiraceae bacterium]|nr:ROK family protein [Saprospiraceae bacterium]
MADKKTLYKRNILKHFYFAQSLSCADLCERTDKSLPLITKLINELIEEGKVIETGLAPSTGGRRPLMYSIKPDILYVIAVSMDQLVTRIALVDMANNYVGDIERIDLKLANNAQSLAILTKAIAEFIQKTQVATNKIAGIGIAMPGFIDVKKGINYSFLHSTEGSVTKYISKVVGVPVFIDNDSSLIALAELRFGAAQNERNAMVINMGWGVGLGLILDGELYRGDNGFAGEFSHIPVFTNNKLCSCGKNGCLETETSLLVLVEKAIEGLKTGRVSSLKDIPQDNPEKANNIIIQLALEGDQFAVELLSDIGYKIGRGVAILIHLLNPKLIVLSGRGSMAGKIWQAPIQQALNEYCIPKLSHNTTITVSELGYHAELIGAATLVMENFERIKEHKSELVEVCD